MGKILSVGQKTVSVVVLFCLTIFHFFTVYGQTPTHKISFSDEKRFFFEELKTSDEWHKSGVLGESFSNLEKEVVIITNPSGWDYYNERNQAPISWCNTLISKKQFNKLALESSFSIEKGTVHEIPTHCDDEIYENSLQLND